MPTRLLVLGIDAASPALLRRWAAEGRLPAIRALIDRGTSGAVRGVEGFFIGSTWPSLYTGLNPANHGFHRIEQLSSGSYDFFRPLESPGGVGGVPFWKVASDAGRRVAVLDVPLSRLDRELNGTQIVEWGGHDVVFGFHASSEAAAARVIEKVGRYPIPSNCDAPRRTATDFERFVSGLESAAGMKAEITLDLLARESWDLFVQVFTETHCVGHQCWHLHDATHPAHDPEVARVLGDPLERVYRAVDRAVDAILQQASDARVLLIAAHGMGPYRGAQFLLPEILLRLGVTLRPQATEGGDRGPLDPVVAAAGWCWRALPESARALLRPLRARFGPPVHDLGGVEVDVTRSRCFAVPNGSPVGAIRLNLAGREPGGILRPGAESDRFCEELERDLRDVLDERTGRPLVTAVHRTDALYRGARRDGLPDLLVEWDPELGIGSTAHAGGRGAHVSATSARIGRVEGSNRSGRTGEHLPTGMFVCAGPGIAAIERKAAVSIMDFHPTLCGMLGIDGPRVDGIPIPEVSGSLG